MGGYTREHEATGDTHADDAFVVSRSKFTSTRSTTCTTPFSTSTSDFTICALALPLVTNAPDEFDENVNGSPDAEMKDPDEDPRSVGEYSADPLMYCIVYS